MANTPKKMKDPTEAALSAIQDALQVRDDDKPAEGIQSGPALPPDDPGADKPWPGLRSKQSKTRDLDDEIRPEDAGALRRPAANDDRESIGTILRSLQQRPSSSSLRRLPPSWPAALGASGSPAAPPGAGSTCRKSRPRSARPASPRRCWRCSPPSISRRSCCSTCSPTWRCARRRCG